MPERKSNTILGKPVAASPPDTSPLNSSMVILAGQNVEKFIIRMTNTEYFEPFINLESSIGIPSSVESIIQSDEDFAFRRGY